MARTGSPARLVIALSVAAVLAVFLLYASIAGGGTPSLKPSELRGHTGRVTVSGKVIGKPRGDPRGDGLRFSLRDVDGNATVRVLFRGSKPDLFASGRHVYVEGRLRNRVFVADKLVAKCPSKYAPEKRDSSRT